MGRRAMTGGDLGTAGPARYDVAPCAATERSSPPVGQTKQGAWPVTGEDRRDWNRQSQLTIES